jgi:hypothetical protein
MVTSPGIQALSYIIFVAAEKCINSAVTLKDVHNLQHVTHVAEKNYIGFMGMGGGPVAVQDELDPS